MKRALEMFREIDPTVDLRLLDDEWSVSVESTGLRLYSFTAGGALYCLVNEWRRQGTVTSEQVIAIKQAIADMVTPEDVAALHRVRTLIVNSETEHERGAIVMQVDELIDRVVGWTNVGKVG